jgi:two-component system CheB/CheR fusion protein
MENFLGATDIATIFLDNDLNIRRYTPKVAELLMLMPQDIGRRIDTFALRLRTPDLLDHIQSVLRSGLPVEAESQAFSGRYFLVRVIPYRTTDTIEGVVVTMIDITSLKQKEQDLRLSEERYRTLVQASEGVIWNMDSAGSVTVPQPAWEKQTAQRWEEYRGLGWMSSVLEQDRARVLQLFGTGYADGEVRSTLALVWNAEHQESRVCSIRVVALKDDSSNTKEWIGVLTDAHELHRSRALLGDTDVLRNILDASPALICVQDVIGRYILVNREFEGVVGKPANEIEGKGDYDIFPIAVAERMRAHHLEVIHSESVREHEEVLRVGDSDRIFLAARCPVRSAEKGLYGVALIATDITERKAGEKEALEGIRLRDTFLATISHEIRNPLHAILSAASLFRDEGEKPEVRQKAAGVVVRQAQQMARLVEDLLDLSRSRQGKIRVYRKQLDLRSIVEPVLEQIRSEYDDREQQLTVKLPAEPLFVNGDGERLRQMLVNLLDNASKYSPHGSIVELRVTAENQRARIEVRDAGQGIAKEQIPNIFDQFMQVDPKAVPRSQGMGLGLWVVSQIVREHRGSIEVQSEGIGKGSVFTVLLPTIDDQRDLGIPADTARSNSGGERVLLVEDNKDSREMLQFILQSEGFSVEVAKDGQSAMELLAIKEPSAALVDIGLPDMSGLDLARRVREKDPDHHITLIAISGYGSDEDKQSASQAGFDAYLTKPVQIGDVVALLRA